MASRTAPPVVLSIPPQTPPETPEHQPKLKYYTKLNTCITYFVVTMLLLIFLMLILYQSMEQRPFTLPSIQISQYKPVQRIFLTNKTKPLNNDSTFFS
jgi:hypothetical protein